VFERDEWAETRRKAVVAVLHAWRTGDVSALAFVLADDVEVQSLDLLCFENACSVRGKQSFLAFVARHGQERPRFELVDFLLPVGGVIALLRDESSFCAWECQVNDDGRLTHLRISLSVGRDFGEAPDDRIAQAIPNDKTPVRHRRDAAT